MLRSQATGQEWGLTVRHTHFADGDPFGDFGLLLHCTHRGIKLLNNASFDATALVLVCHPDNHLIRMLV